MSSHACKQRHLLTPASSHQKEELHGRIDTLVQAFGLADQADAFIGRVLSNGQRRRLAVARRLVTGPKVLFLDEPTSGLDSVASFYVISYLRKIAKLNNLIIICSIHQPSTSTFDLFDKLLLLSRGRTHYFGPTAEVVEYYQNVGVTIPQRANPAEFILELLNIDFSDAPPTSSQSITKLQSLWRLSSCRQRILDSILTCERATCDVLVESASRPSLASHIVTLIHRNFLKAYRDAMAYNLRLLMYTGLGLLMGTIWLRLDRNQDSIQLLVNALIVSCGFMAFMAVTYVPAFIEDYRQYLQEHRNGLYGATAFHISNFLVGIPHLFLFSMMFSVVFYWLSNCQPSATAFFTWVMWLFFDLLAAEAVVVLAVTIVPNFVGSLVLAALINVLMFGTAGTLVPPGRLNAFYKYGLYYWNFQAYIFQGMMVTQFDHQTYDCGSNCACRYTPMSTDQCHIDGGQVLHEFGIETGVEGRNIVIVIAIILGYRVASWAALRFKQ